MEKNNMSNKLVAEKETLQKRIQEIDEKLQKIAELKKEANTLRTLESYTPEEKIKVFDDFFKLARSIVDGSIEQHSTKDDHVYCYDSILGLLGDLNLTQKIMDKADEV